MKKQITLVAAAAMLTGAVGATTASARLATDTSNKSVDQPCVNAVTGQEEGTFTWDGPTASWPPNHKDKTASITLTDTDGDPVNGVFLTVVGTHDEILADGTELNGSGNTPAVTDASSGAAEGAGSATVPVRWRAERSGRGDGRVYTFTAGGNTDSAPGVANPLSECEPVTFTVAVPHDQSGSRKAKSKKARRLSLRRR